MAGGPIQRRAELLAGHGFLGGPVEDFERVGRLGFDVLLREGLHPSSRVLDVGCGALRLGYWLMRFLDAGCYYGIEPNEKMLALGLDQVIEAEVTERAAANFAHNEDFDLSVFGAKFDFVYARSVWTHTSRQQISAMLGSFAAVGAPDSVLLASFHSTSRVLRAARHRPELRAKVLTSLPLETLGNCRQTACAPNSVWLRR